MKLFGNLSAVLIVFAAALYGLSTVVLVGPTFGQPSQPPDEQTPAIKVTPIKIDPNTPLQVLLPTAPKTEAKIAPPFNEDLRLVPEIGFGQPISRKLQIQEAVQQTANIFAKVNHLNKKKKDGFLEALITQRPDLHGLPFRMGDECRTSEAQGRILPFLSATVNDAVKAYQSGSVSLDVFTDTLAELQTRPTLTTSKGLKMRVSRDNEDNYYRALVSTLIQVLGPEPEKPRTRLARSLATIPHVDATKALAQLALFAPEKEVRATALEGLRLRSDKDYTDILLQGFQYPLPEVSKRAAEALIKLERKDLLANLVDVLERPDPRLPSTRMENGKEAAVVRELVKVNHHHNCVLCHAPANTPDVPEWALKVTVPLPSEPFSESYLRPKSKLPIPPEIFVRIDMTYLRQDFSLMMPVANPDPWPVQQRFDFFVRTRALTPQEAQAWQVGAKDGLSPYQQSALLALRELTGRDTQPTAQAWRALLKLPVPSVP
jgi:hypothetical protein